MGGTACLQSRERERGGGPEVPHLDLGVRVIPHGGNDLEALRGVPGDVGDVAPPCVPELAPGLLLLKVPDHARAVLGRRGEDVRDLRRKRRRKARGYAGTTLTFKPRQGSPAAHLCVPRDPGDLVRVLGRVGLWGRHEGLSGLVRMAQIVDVNCCVRTTGGEEMRRVCVRVELKPVQGARVVLHGRDLALGVRWCAAV